LFGWSFWIASYKHAIKMCFFIILNYFYSNIKAGCDFRQFKIALRNNKMSTRDDNISNAKRWRTIIFHLSLQILYKYVVFNIKSLSSMSSAALWSNLCILYWIMFRFSLPNFPNVLIDFLCVLEIVVVLGFMNSFVEYILALIVVIDIYWATSSGVHMERVPLLVINNNLSTNYD
jgi:hypothetical protein